VCLLVSAPAHQDDCMVQLSGLQGAAPVTVHTLTAGQRGSRALVQSCQLGPKQQTAYRGALKGYDR
jgi:hypothetical protein